MANKTVVLGTRINSDVNEALKSIAENYGVTLSHLVNAILLSFVNEYSKQLVEKFSLDDENTPSVE